MATEQPTHIPTYWADRTPTRPTVEHGEPSSPPLDPPAPARQSSLAPILPPVSYNEAPFTASGAISDGPPPARHGSLRRLPPGTEIQRYYPEGEPRRSEDFPGAPRSVYVGESRRTYRDAYPDRDLWYDDDPRRPPRSGAYRRVVMRPAAQYQPGRRSVEVVDTPKGGYYSDDEGRIYYYSEEEEGLRAAAGGAGGNGGGGGGGGGYRGKSAAEMMRERPPSEVLRLPWTMWMNSNAKNHFVAAMGEFVGTTMFLFFAFAGTQVANIGSSTGDNTTTGGSTGFSPIVLLYISLVFSFSLMVNVWVFFRISGGLFNPAVTLAMLMTKSITIARFILLIIAQLAGSIFASFLVKVMFPTELNVRTTLSSTTSIVRGVFIEAILTAELVFTIFMLAKEKHKATFIAPVGIGLALFIAELVGVFYTGGSLNPARSFGPCVVTGIFDREHWIYWIGPGGGAIIAVLFYQFIKILEYEMANPGQDDDDREQQHDVEKAK